MIEETSRHWVTQLLRDESELLRGEILAGHTYAADTLEALLLERVHIRSRERRHGLLKRVINATGVVVHTNLGRSPLAKRALERVVEVSSGYCNLEYDLPGRRRGGRMFGVQDALRQLTGAEDALVVNNNAAAVMLALSAMAERQEVILSRGELVEIGGSFRIPD
ncbi:MAG TPA: L-seryl-tRNA(Sec) selenium transferase, partial [Myxococcales bacterium]|nr:L-seryl-tRNA(Sec) selenium transferase [Myxococcales bacterium]